MQQTSVQINNKVNERQEKGGFNMFKNLRKRIKNEKGLTLIELLAVIVILAIVAAIAIPAIGNIISNSEKKAVKSDALNILNASNIYITDNSGVNKIEYKTKAYKVYDSKGTEITSGVGSFSGFIESLGEFKNVDFTVEKTSNGLTITAADVGKHLIDFNKARIDIINAKDADDDGTTPAIEGVDVP